MSNRCATGYWDHATNSFKEGHPPMVRTRFYFTKVQAPYRHLQPPDSLFYGSISATTTTRSPRDCINRLPNELLDDIFQSMAQDDCGFQEYRAVLSPVSPRWNELMKNITSYWIYNERQAVALTALFRRDPSRALEAKEMSVKYSWDMFRATNEIEIIQKLLLTVPNLIKLYLVSHQVSILGSSVALGLAPALKSLKKMEDFELLDTALLIKLDLNDLASIVSWKKLKRLVIPSACTEIPNVPSVIRIKPLFTSIVEMRIGTWFNSTNDVKVVLEIIKRSAPTLRIMQLWLWGGGIDALKILPKDNSIPYYALDLNLTKFEFFHYTQLPQDSQIFYFILLKQSNLLSHITGYQRKVVGIVEDTLTRFRNVTVLDLAMTGWEGNEAQLKSELASLLSALKSNKLSKLSEIVLRLEGAGLGVEIVAKHPLYAECAKRDIALHVVPGVDDFW